MTHLSINYTFRDKSDYLPIHITERVQRQKIKKILYEKKNEKKKSKSEKSKEKKKEVAPSEGKEVPYPLVPSKKDKERHLVHFLDIFKKLEITMPFREAL